MIQGLGYTYPGGSVPALDGIDLTVDRGEILGIIGATGAGKSTLCLALNGIVPQFFGGTFFGSVRLAGDDTVDTPTSRLAATVGMVFEDPETQITATTVEAEVAFALENLKVPTGEMAARVRAALDATGLSGLELKHPAALSGGQKQRLAIAAALALTPALIVLDEPTSQLDPHGTSEVFMLLRQLARERGVAVIVASHASEELAEVAQRIVLLADGRIVRDGTPAEVLGDVELLKRHHVRPPDIAQAYVAVASEAMPGERVPVTLQQADEAFRPLRSQLFCHVRAVRQEAPLAVPVALEAEGLSHVYPDGTQALRHVDLRIGRGEFVAIGGRNGCGKSTLVRHFLHLLSASLGTVRVLEADVSALKVSELAGRIGYVAQNAHLQLFCDSVAEEVTFALRMTGRPAVQVQSALTMALTAMKLEDLADRHPMSLSRGDRLRVAIAVVLALGPEILIFDEPTTGQDWQGAMAILEICRELNQAGRTIVLVTHHLYLLPGYAKRMIVMKDGRIALDGPLADVFYARELRAASLAPPQTVSFAGTIDTLSHEGCRPLCAADLQACLPPGRMRTA